MAMQIRSIGITEGDKFVFQEGSPPLSSQSSLISPGSGVSPIRRARMLMQRRTSILQDEATAVIYINIIYIYIYIIHCHSYIVYSYL